MSNTAGDSLPARILVVDDHSVVRDGLALIIERENDMTIVGSAATGKEGVDAYNRHRPDVVLMDLNLPEMSGVEAIRAIKECDPNARIVVLTMHDGDEDIYRALEAGATTYVLKGCPSEDLIRAVRTVHAGGRPVLAQVKTLLEDRATRPALTRREIDVLQLVFHGYRNKEIARQLSISDDTVEVHLKSIFTKLNVHDRTAAVYIALRRGIIHVD